MPVKPAYQSRPSSRIGRQACAAIETRIASVTSRPCAPMNCFSARNSSASSRSFGVVGKERQAAGGVAPQRVVDAVLAQHAPAAPVRSASPCPVKYRMVSVVQLHPQSSAAALEPLAAGLAPRRARAASAARSSSPSRSTPGSCSPPASRPGRMRSALPRPRRDRRSTRRAAPRACCSRRRSTSRAPRSCSERSARRSPRSPPAWRSSTSCASPRAARRASRTRCCARWCSAWSRTCAWC